MIKIAIIGSRKFSSPHAINIVISSLVNKLGADKFMVVSGGAEGVDIWAENCADALGVAKDIIKPIWYKNGVYDPGAGFERNTWIVERADRMIAFWDGVSHGTMDSVFKAKDMGKKVVVFDAAGKAIEEARWVRPR